MYSKGEIDEIRALEKRLVVADQWDMYLMLIRAKDRQFPAEVMREMKRSFYAGFGQMLFLCHDALPELEEEPAIDAMNNMMIETREFWATEAKAFNKEQNN